MATYKEVYKKLIETKNYYSELAGNAKGSGQAGRFKRLAKIAEIFAESIKNKNGTTIDIVKIDCRLEDIVKEAGTSQFTVEGNIRVIGLGTGVTYHLSDYTPIKRGGHHRK